MARKRMCNMSTGVCWLVLMLIQLGATDSHRWCPKQCDCFVQFTTVDCSSKNLRDLPQLSNVTKRLYLGSNRLEKLADTVMAGTPELIVLHAQNNSLREISAHTLCHLKKVQLMDLSKNKISSFSVPPDDSCLLPQLTGLALDENKLRKVPSNLSHFAPNLDMLSLSQNDISSAYLDDSFENMLSLQHLDLSKNHIHSIEASDFASIKGIPLEILLLSDIGLVQIDPQALAGMQNLTYLSLSHSLVQKQNLEQVFSNFGNTSTIARLDLSEMSLVNLTVAMLGMFKKLLIMEVKNSDVEFIEPGVFDSLINLETMYLEHNKLCTVDNIAALKKLRRLYLKRNNIAQISLNELSPLEYVDLSQNNITELPGGWLNATDTLQLLNISYNQISHISVNTFNKVTLHTLDMSHNRLTILHRYGLVKLRNLDLSHNLLTSISDDAFDDLDQTIEELDLSHNNFTRFPPHIYQDFIALQRLYLNNNHLGEAFRNQTLGSLFHSLGHLQVLDLSYNGISVLPHEQFQYLHHLTALFLTGNKIMDLADLSLQDMSSLAKLVVSRNRLSSVETDMLSKFEYLEVIDLSDNPYQCTCNLMPFLYWLNTTEVTVLNSGNHQKYSCSFPPTKAGWYIKNYHPAHLECVPPKQHSVSKSLAIFGVICGSLTALAGTMALIFYYGQVCHRIKSLHYRWQIRYREVSGVEFSGDPKA